MGLARALGSEVSSAQPSTCENGAFGFVLTNPRLKKSANGGSKVWSRLTPRAARLGGDQDAPAAYCASSFSIADVTSGESGLVAGSKRFTTWPLRSTRNFVKFHLMSPARAGFASVVR